MAKINEYPQAATINNNDLFVIDQQSGGDHATKSASVSQIESKVTAEVKEDIGDLSTLTTTVKSSLVGAVNEVNSTKANASDFEGCKMKGFVIAGGATVTVTGSTGIIVASANNNDATAGAYAFSNMGGSFRLKTLASGSGVTITATRTDGVITFTNGGASYIQGVIVYA